VLSFKGWQSQAPGSKLPLTTAQGDVSSTNTWATIGLGTTIAAVAGLTGAVIAW
jgi:hypothetical protein